MTSFLHTSTLRKVQRFRAFRFKQHYENQINSTMLLNGSCWLLFSAKGTEGSFGCLRKRWSQGMLFQSGKDFINMNDQNGCLDSVLTWQLAICKVSHQIHSNVTWSFPIFISLVLASQLSVSSKIPVFGSPKEKQVFRSCASKFCILMLFYSPSDHSLSLGRNFG